MKNILIILGILTVINLLIVTISKSFAEETSINIYTQELQTNIPSLHS